MGTNFTAWHIFPLPPSFSFLSQSSSLLPPLFRLWQIRTLVFLLCYRDPHQSRPVWKGACWQQGGRARSLTGSVCWANHKTFSKWFPQGSEGLRNACFTQRVSRTPDISMFSAGLLTAQVRQKCRSAATPFLDPCTKPFEWALESWEWLRHKVPG